MEEKLFINARKSSVQVKKRGFRSLAELLRNLGLVVSSFARELAYQNGEHADRGGGGQQKLL